MNAELAIAIVQRAHDVFVITETTSMATARECLDALAARLMRGECVRVIRHPIVEIKGSTLRHHFTVDTLPAKEPQP